MPPASVDIIRASIAEAASQLSNKARCNTIVEQEEFTLVGWTPELPTGFLMSLGTLDDAFSL